MAQNQIPEEHILALKEILPSSALFDSSSSKYPEETRCWAAQKDLHPELVVRPENIKQLQESLRYLYNSGLDFAIRSGGIGGSSSRDVIVSLSAFNGFKFDPENKTITIGAGQTWDAVGIKLEEEAPGYAVVGARTPFVGIGGSLVHGGIGWLSHEFGLGSDPQNMLDAYVVLTDGRALWASEEPDLLWALRGGGGNFAVVTEFKLQCHQYTNEIYSGMIIVPLEQIDEISSRVSAFASQTEDPKMALHVFLGDFAGSAAQGNPATPSMMFLVYDAHGEAHGRSDSGFKWALDIPGAIDISSAMTLRGVHDTQKNLATMTGVFVNYLNAALVDEIDTKFLVRAWNWYQKVIATDNRLGACSFVLLEVMQKKAFSTASTTDMTAWPHTSSQHVLQLLTGFVPGSGASHEQALEFLRNGPSEIAVKHDSADYFPNFIESHNDIEKIYGVNYLKLRQVKKKYDSEGKLNKGSNSFIPPA